MNKRKISFTIDQSKENLFLLVDNETHKVKINGRILSVTLLKNDTGVALVEFDNTTGVSNARIIDLLGETRFNLKLPDFIDGVMEFSDMYYIGDELTLIVMLPGRDIAVVVNPEDGTYSRFYETR